jgi:hypothetical protein
MLAVDPARRECDAGAVRAGSHHTIRCAVVHEEGVGETEPGIHRVIPAENACQDHDPSAGWDKVPAQGARLSRPRFPSIYREEKVEKKFDRLVAGRIDDGLSKQIKDAVRSLESIQVSDLMALLVRTSG